MTDVCIMYGVSYVGLYCVQLSDFALAACVICLWLFALQDTKVLDMWFRIDARPFKQALLNTVKRWSLMFKQHLLNHVTHRSARHIALKNKTFRFTCMVSRDELYIFVIAFG